MYPQTTEISYQCKEKQRKEVFHHMNFALLARLKVIISSHTIFFLFALMMYFKCKNYNGPLKVRF